jgi:hypothetical protein
MGADPSDRNIEENFVLREKYQENGENYMLET